ncbi:MAG TPA: alpha/beta fold hydrolase, partial [Myxococcaceae bacterium]|nr:alpha/beta fold hydrolase [Myxococcaceae bacterium]
PLPRVPSWIRAGMRAVSAVSPGSAALLARGLLFTPLPRARVKDREREVLETGVQLSWPVMGRRMVARAWGTGPTVLLVHGWGGHGGQLTPWVRPLVEAGFRAVALDLPAHGASSGRLSSLVHFAAALRRAGEEVGPVHGAVGHSMGAAGVTYALAQGLSVQRAVFIAPPLGFDEVWARFRAEAGVSQEVWRRMQRSAERWLKIRFEDVNPDRWAPAMTVPLLVIHAADDAEVPFAEGAALAAQWPGATLQRVEALGHRRVLQDASSIAAAVRFLRGA